MKDFFLLILSKLVQMKISRFHFKCHFQKCLPIFLDILTSPFRSTSSSTSSSTSTIENVQNLNTSAGTGKPLKSILKKPQSCSIATYQMKNLKLPPSSKYAAKSSENEKTREKKTLTVPYKNPISSQTKHLIQKRKQLS